MAVDTPIIEAIQRIDSSSLQIALVVDGDLHLLGTVTDGDVRRGILKRIPLDRPVREIMNRSPIVAAPDESPETVLARLKQHLLHQIPVVDVEGRLTGLETIDHMLEMGTRDNWVVLMAGGQGARLRPLTEAIPKPLVQIGSKPVLETILESFIEHGFRRFYLSVNYKAEKIKECFGEGSRWGVEIRYLCEEAPMGTAGALSLLPERPSECFIVMNADLLTTVDFNQLLRFHNEHDAQATMCVREYQTRIPYGVVSVDQHRFVAIEEKPLQRYFVNAGIYALEPSVLDVIDGHESLDMTDLFARVAETVGDVVVFPIREYWIDIGQREDLERAQTDYDAHFSENGE